MSLIFAWIVLQIVKEIARLFNKAKQAFLYGDERSFGSYGIVRHPDIDVRTTGGPFYTRYGLQVEAYNKNPKI